MQDITLVDTNIAADAVSVAVTVPVVNVAHEAELHPFRFTGTTGGFFAIWIVNLFLTIITLGIYSAWATVRKKRYFYGHTWVAGANFEYHGNPLAILKGRLIAVAAFAVYSAVGHFLPKVAAALALLLFAAAPWFINRSMAFNAFNSSYRNIRFRFQATYIDVLKAIWPIALVLVFPFLMPDFDREGKVPPPTLFWVILSLQMLAIVAVYQYVIGALKKLHVNHSQFGTTPFALNIGLGAFYKIYFLMMLLALGAVMVAGIVGAIIIGVVAVMGAGAANTAMMLIPVFVVVGYVVMGSLLLAYTKSRIGNLVFNNSHLGNEVGFVSSLKPRKLAWLYLVNMFAILFSLGLAVPWAVIRVVRYRAECLALQSSTSLDTFIAGVNAQVGATGEELGEFFSVDLSL